MANNRRRRNSRRARSRYDLPFGPFWAIWDTLEFPLFRPTLERGLFLGMWLLIIVRYAYYLVVGNWAVPFMPGILFGVTLRVPVLPLMRWPVLGWYGGLALIIFMLVYTHRRLFRDTSKVVRDPTWTPLFYLLWALLGIMGLFSYY